MPTSGAQHIRLSAIQAIVALADNKFSVNKAAYDLGIMPTNLSVMLGRLIKSSSVEIFTYYSHDTKKRSKLSGLTFEGHRILKHARELLKAFNLLEDVAA